MYRLLAMSACAWLMALAPPQGLKPVFTAAASPSAHMLRAQDAGSLYGDADNDGDDDGDGFCNDGMQTLPFADDLDVLPVSDRSSAACDEQQYPVAI